MTMTVVEIHVPLMPVPGLGEDDYAFPWIEDVEEFLAGLEEAEEFDSGEEWGEFYVFFVAGAPEEVLLAVAARVAGSRGCRPARSPSSVTTNRRSSGSAGG
jgi:hypothetical protein